MSVAEYDKMSLEQLEKKLTKKEKRFVEELEADGNGSLAAVRAGLLEGKAKKSAAVIALGMLRNPRISAYREARINEIYRQLGISPESIIMKLNTVYTRCMQAEQVLTWDSDEKAWVPSGQWQFDAKNALKALELMGKSQGMFADKVINENRNLTLEEYLAGLEKEERSETVIKQSERDNETKESD